MSIRKNHIIILVAIIASIAIRLPNINRPLSKHHEFVTAHTLRVMQIWKEGGIANYHFAPVMNYAGGNDKYINNQSMGYSDDKGDYYYLSYPPFGFMLPYFVSLAFHLPVSPLVLQLFNILLHILSALLLYRIVLLLVSPERREAIATLATVFFLINPCSLWFFSNAYFADMPIIFFWPASIYLLLLIRNNNNHFKIILLFVVLGLGNYTEYLGLFFSLCAVLFVWKSRYENRRVITIAILLSILIPYALTLYQYSLIGGWEALWRQSVLRYKVRSGYAYNDFLQAFIYQWKTVVMNYAVHYIAFLILIATVLVFYFVRGRRDAMHGVSTGFNKKAFLYLIIAPVLLHHIIFLNATMHDFQVLKSSVPLVILASYILYSRANKLATPIAIAIIVFNIADYYYVNKPGRFSRNGDEYATDYMIAREIKEAVDSTYVIFINTDVSPQTVYYTGRNIHSYSNPENAHLFLQNHNLSKGIMLYFDTANKISAAEIVIP